MSEQRAEPVLREHRTISLNQEYEVRYWTKSLRVTEDQLRELVVLFNGSELAIRQALRNAAVSGNPTNQQPILRAS